MLSPIAPSLEHIEHIENNVLQLGKNVKPKLKPLRGKLQGYIWVQMVEVPAFTSAVYFIRNSASIRLRRLTAFITVSADNHIPLRL